MQNALSDTELELIRNFTATNVLLAFDYDGTLAPIVADPAQAFMTPVTRELLWQVSRRYPVIVISGRAQPDALRRVRGVGVREVVGNHGIEPRHAANRHIRRVESWRSALEACVAAWPGVWLEDKIYSVAVHYRNAPNRGAARAAIVALARELEEARVLGGKEVVNILPRDAPDKGSALLREKERLGCSCAIYVGDDETDEYVFTHTAPQHLLGIRVEDSPDSRATHFIPDQPAIDLLLSLFIALRPRIDESPTPSGSAPEP
jgi:trehalose 6-phosphate phosphatase